MINIQQTGTIEPDFWVKIDGLRLNAHAFPQQKIRLTKDANNKYSRQNRQQTG
jgi:hypothetical protein